MKLKAFPLLFFEPPRARGNWPHQTGKSRRGGSGRRAQVGWLLRYIKPAHPPTAEAGADPDGQSSFERQDAVLALPVGAARRPCRIFQLECMAMRAAMIISVLIVSCAAGHAMDCKDQTQMGLNQCAAVSYEKADEALNKAYKEALLRLKDRGDAAGLLAKAQKSWLAFRDSECAFSSSGVSGGSIYPMIHAICLETLTRERTKQLRNYLHCEEGDLSCPVPAR